MQILRYSSIHAGSPFHRRQFHRLLLRALARQFVEHVVLLIRFGVIVVYLVYIHQLSNKFDHIQLALTFFYNIQRINYWLLIEF